MRITNKIAITCSIVLCWLGCLDPPKEPSIIGIWEGQYRDAVAQWPLSVYRVFENDSLAYTLQSNGDVVVQDYQHFSEYLKIDTTLWEIKLLNNEELRMEKEEELFVFKRVNEKTILEDSINYFYHKYWKTIVDNKNGLIEELTFNCANIDSCQTMKNYFYDNKLIYQEQLEMRFAVSNFKQQYFLRQSILTQKKDTITESIQLIKQFNKNKIKTNKAYFQLGKPFENAVPFTFCQSKKPRIYQYQQLKYEGGKKAVEAFFFNRYKNTNKKGNGFISISFTVNCEGKVGDFQLEQVNEEWKEALFNYEIVHQLVNTVAQMPHWIPAQNEEGETIDSRTTLIFKMNEGQLIKVLP